MNTEHTVEQLVKIGLCQPKFYTPQVWRKANNIMLECCAFGLVWPHNFGRGKGKYNTNLSTQEIARQYTNRKNSNQ